MIPDSILEHVSRVASKMPVGQHRMESSVGAMIVTIASDRSVSIKPLFASIGGHPKIPWVFSRVVVINRPDRRDRKIALETHLREIAWPFASPIWHSATPGDKLNVPSWWKSTRNTWGNLQSHLQVIREAYASGAEHVLVMEDDCIYMPGFLDRISRFMSSVPDSWGILMFGGRAGTPTPKVERVTSDVWKIAGWNNLESYAVSRAAMPRVIEALANATEHSDVALQSIQWEVGTYHMNPPIAIQRGGRSDNFGNQKGESQARLEVDPKQGAIIMSSGSRRRHLLANSTASFRRNNPRLSLRVISDRMWEGYDCEVVPEFGGFDSRSVKTRILSSPKLEAGVILDDDTITLAPIPSIKEVLGGFDLALIPDSIGTVGGVLDSKKEAVMNWLGKEEADFMRERFHHLRDSTHWNTGVIFFRNSKAVRDFSAVWHEEWMRFGRIDQMAFCRALDRTGMKIKRIDPRLHYICCGVETIPNGVKIAHMTIGKWRQAEWLDHNGLPNVVPPREVREGCCGGAARMASDFAGVIGATAIDAALGKRVIVSKSVLEERRSVCDGCDRRDGNRCGECGCFLSLAQRLVRKDCPLGKWPQVDR